MDKSHENGLVSALDFDIAREAFRTSLRELNLSEDRWAEHAKQLLQDFTDCLPEQRMIDRIIGRF